LNVDYGRGHENRAADRGCCVSTCPAFARKHWERIASQLRKGIKLVVNRTKSKCAPLAECEFLGFKISKQGKVKWTEKSMKRCKQRVKEITRRNRGASAQQVIDELRKFATGWMNYFGISHTYREVLELDAWMRKRVRLYYWTAPAR
jgi:RNA-directed DNA polymerase